MVVVVVGGGRSGRNFEGEMEERKAGSDAAQRRHVLVFACRWDCVWWVGVTVVMGSIVCGQTASRAFFRGACSMLPWHPQNYSFERDWQDQKT